MMKISIFLLFIFGVCTAQTGITIIHTSNTNGILENCKCPDHAYGALEKRAAAVDSIRQRSSNVLLFDSGDIFDIQPDTLLHGYITRAYLLMGYDAWICGDQDFIDGFDFFQRTLMRLPMQLISCNLDFKSGIRPLKYKIFQKGDVRIGVAGVFDSSILNYASAQVRNSIKVRDAFEELEAVIPDLVQRSDYQILLSHSGFEHDKLLAQTFNDLDLIIGGHSQTLLDQPARIGNTLIVQSGESGYRIGVLRLIFQTKTMQSFNYEQVLLDSTIADDIRIRNMIQEYHNKKESAIYNRRKHE